jgi:hypothetical protein
MLNSTMKMVRGKIVEYYRSRLDYLYTVEGRSILNDHNRAIVLLLTPYSLLLTSYFFRTPQVGGGGALSASARPSVTYFVSPVSTFVTTIAR